MIKSNKVISLGGHLIGAEQPPFVIAEMSGNHNKSLDRALLIVEAAARAGVHGFKIQTYTPDTMTIDLDEREFHISDPESIWGGISLYELYKEAYTPWEWHEPIFRRARELGMVPFSTPYDDTSVDFLMDLGVPCFKISSFENMDIPLIRKVASSGKPLFISTGMATLAELDETVRAARDAGCNDLILLKCTSTYPSTPVNTNIQTIPHMREMFGCEIGLSDHTGGIGAAVAAVAVGARVIEKHFTLNRNDGGVDSKFSLEPSEMLQLVTESRRAWQSLGSIVYGPLDVESTSVQFRRSLYVVKDVKADEILTSENVRSIRPGFGMSIKFKEIVLGRRFKVDVPRGTALAWNLIS